MNLRAKKLPAINLPRLGLAAASALLLAGCATQPTRMAALGSSRFDPRLGVSSSERVVQPGDPVPRGGGSYLTGRPYVIGGREYVPRQNAEGYSVVGTASWYGDAFHGRRTANGEVFDKGSVSAAHPTLPLPSYVRVTNLGNGRSMIVRVNDRGPYHGSRVMDVSQRVAENLDFRRSGTARIRVDYVSKASLSGSDDEMLMATLRTDGTLAQLNGHGAGEGGTALASLGGDTGPASPAPSAPPQPNRAAREARNEDEQVAENDAGRPVRGAVAPLPPARPFDMQVPAGREAPGRRTRFRDRLAASNDGRRS